MDMLDLNPTMHVQVNFDVMHLNSSPNDTLWKGRGPSKWNIYLRILAQNVLW